jgi:hypothetical protein
MANRVTHTEVVAIISTSITDVTPFIDSANVIIDSVIEATDSVSDEVLKEMELWLAAHLVAVREGVPQAEKTGDAQVTYQGKTGMGLMATTYGQQVLLLDPTGRFAERGTGKKRASIAAIEFDVE